MNQDPVNQKWREISWRRPLTEAEQAEWRAALLAHPEAQAEAEAEAALSAALAKLPDAPMPSNFTARVLQSIEREEAAAQRQPTRMRPSWWRVLAPRLGVAGLVLGSAVFFWQRHNVQQQQLVNAAREVAEARVLSDPAVLDDFEIIASLTPTETAADDGLLAMSEDLLAIGN